MRALIEQKWPKTKDLVINKILYPFLGFMTVFITYTLMDFMVLDVSDIIAFSLFNFTLCLTKAVLYIFMSYFISIEVKKAFSSSPKKYLNQPSLYLDLIPCVLIIFSDFVRYYEPSNAEMSHFIRLLLLNHFYYCNYQFVLLNLHVLFPKFLSSCPRGPMHCHIIVFSKIHP